MTSPAELQRLLDEMGSRHRRLLELLPQDDDRGAALLDELTKLGGQLIVAGEELRMQQERLTADHDGLGQLAAKHDELHSSVHPRVLTDSRGVVLEMNRGAQQLIRKFPVQTAVRPIATWFEVGDRRVVRGMMAQVTGLRRLRAEGRGVLRRPDGSTVTVQLSVTPTIEPSSGHPRLLWELLEQRNASEPTPLRPVNGQSTEAEKAGFALVAELASLAAELAGCRGEDELLELVLGRVSDLLPLTAAASVLVFSRHRAHTVAATNPAARNCDSAQRSASAGPAYVAVAQGEPVAVAEIAADNRWASWRDQAGEAGLRSALCLPLSTDQPRAVLSLYSRQPEAYGDLEQFTAAALALHAGLALGACLREENLRVGMATRAVIGEAMGVLMERRRIPREAAFGELVTASQRLNVKLREVAESVVTSGQEPAELRLS